MAGKNIVPIVAIFLTVALSACGKQDSKNEELRLLLVAAEGEAQESLFWGVSEHEIQWIDSTHGVRVFPWDGSSALQIYPVPGDRLVYVGRGGGSVLVRGEARVDGVRALKIPIRRIL